MARVLVGSLVDAIGLENSSWLNESSPVSKSGISISVSKLLSNCPNWKVPESKGLCNSYWGVRTDRSRNDKEMGSFPEAILLSARSSANEKATFPFFPDTEGNRV